MGATHHVTIPVETSYGEPEAAVTPDTGSPGPEAATGEPGAVEGVDAAAAPEGEQGEPAEAPDPDAAVAQSIADITDSHWFKGMDQALSELERNAFSVDPAKISELPIEAQEYIHNVLKMNQRATGKFSEAAKEALRREHAAAEKERLAAAERERMLGFFEDPQVKELLDGWRNAGNGKAVDPYSPEGIEQRVNQGVAQRLDEFLQALGASRKQQLEQFQQAEAERAKQQQYAEVNAYIAQHEDLAFVNGQPSETFKAVQSLLAKTRGPDGQLTMTVEEAHTFVRGQQLLLAQQQADPVAASRARARQAARPATASRGVAQMPDGLSSEQQLQWLERHPEAADDLFKSNLSNGY